MALFGNGIDRATSELRKLREARATLQEKTAAAEQELGTLRAGLADLELENLLGSRDAGEQLETAKRRIPQLEVELTGAPGLEQKIISRLRDAIRTLNHVKAEEVRKSAAKIQAELDKHSQKARELQNALELHEQCVFMPEVKQIVSDDGRLGWQYAISKTQQLTNQLANLHAEAAAIESRPIGGGGANAAGLDELLEAVNSDPEGIPPGASAIRAWFTLAEREAQLDWKRTTSDFAGSERLPREMQISLSWNVDTEILPGSSVRIRIAPIPRQVAAETFGAEYIHNQAAD